MQPILEWMTPVSTACCARIHTPDGPFMVMWDPDDGSVIASGWTNDSQDLAERIPADVRPSQIVTKPAPKNIRAAVNAYYNEDLEVLNEVAVKVKTSDFKRSVLKTLRGITPGEPMTYSDLASKAGNPTAIRAAASACATNPIALFIPCHRVVRMNGDLGGFAWGISVKDSLLARETTEELAI